MRNRIFGAIGNRICRSRYAGNVVSQRMGSAAQVTTESSASGIAALDMVAHPKSAAPIVAKNIGRILIVPVRSNSIIRASGILHGAPVLVGVATFGFGAATNLVRAAHA
jgi:hypothetical protein